MKHKSLVIGCILIILVTLGIVLWPIFFSITGQEMGYSLLNFYLIFPLATLACGFYIGQSRTALKWLYLPLAAALGAAMPWLVFGTTGLLTILFGSIAAFSGICLGLIFRKRKNRQQR